MLIEIGHVEAIFRYPVKSTGGERLEVANLGWHGLDGDRRLAFRRMDDNSGFPWLSASKLPALLLFTPHRNKDADGAQGDTESLCGQVYGLGLMGDTEPATSSLGI